MILALGLGLSASLAAFSGDSNEVLEDESESSESPVEWRGWVDLRYRSEHFAVPHGPGADSRYEFSHLRTRAGAEVSRENMVGGLEVQDVHVFGLSDDSPGGAGAAYFGANGGDTSPESLEFRQAWLQFDLDGVVLRGGRQIVRDGAQVADEDPAFTMVRERGAQRLVGGLDWTASGRSFDGLQLTRATEDWVLTAFAVEANAGAFAVQDYGDSLADTRIYGFDLVSPRGRLVPDTELRLFTLAFRDGRDVQELVLGDESNIDVLGGQWTSRCDAGPGAFDVFVWGATQSGDAGSARHRSDAWITELGYRFEGVPGKPWLRAGHARAQGDDDPTDGTNEAFFNGLPTNHLYYGAMDLFAFSNLVTSYVELIVDPHPQVRCQLAYHDFQAADPSSPTAFGSGAFDGRSLGYGARPAAGRQLGREVDLSVRSKFFGGRAHALLGASWFFGDTAFERLFAQEDGFFFFAQTGFRY